MFGNMYSESLGIRFVFIIEMNVGFDDLFVNFMFCFFLMNDCCCLIDLVEWGFQDVFIVLFYCVFSWGVIVQVFKKDVVLVVRLWYFLYIFGVIC